MSTAAGQGLRVAVVGGGPRALWLLERLGTLSRRAGARPLAGVDVFSRDGVLGAGTVYEPLQAPWLRVNVTSRVVNAWVDPAEGPSFDAWREQVSPGSSCDEFPPRSLVGSYLHAQGNAMVERLSAHTRVRIARRDVGCLRRAERGWVLDAQPGSAYDHVVVCSGHEPDWPGALSHLWPGRHSVPLHPRVFPASALVRRPELAREGAIVVVRGAALTALDAALTITRTHAGARVVLVSRTGRPMHPKTLTPIVDRALAAARPRLRDAQSQVAGGASVREVLVESAIALLGAGGGTSGGVGSGREAVAAAVGRIEDASPGRSPREELRHAVRVARGEEPPTGEWALAQAWRALYPSLVRRQAAADHDGPLLEWPEAPVWTRELERWAFGPPLVNAETLLGLIDAGAVELRAGRVEEVATEVGADLVVDAVLPPPGVRDVMPDSLLGRLVADGVVRPAAQGRGALVGVDGSVPGAPGLALVGRATEDVVLGTDTLVRSLHPAPDLWARAVLGLAPDPDGEGRP